jgi:heat shock protein HslJ
VRVATTIGSVLVLTLLAGCADEQASGPGTGGGLEGVVWILDDASAVTLGAPPTSMARATIRFDGDEVGGTAFCNHYGGTYEAQGDALSIEVGFMTEMACEEPSMSLEPAFVAALGEVDGYALRDGTLALSRPDTLALVFDAERPLPLVGTAWRLDGVAAGGGAVSSTVSGIEVTATFDPDGRLTGTAGCNGYGAAYTVDGDAIAIGPPDRTDMLCGPDVMAQEVVFFDGLSRAASFGVQGSSLTLLDADGAFLLSFVGPTDAE